MENVECTQQYITREYIDAKYSMYKTLLFRIAFSYLGNKQDCEDILQETFIKLCYHAPVFPTDEDEKRWLIRITINLCKNQLRSFWNKNRIALDELEEYAQDPEDLELLQVIMHMLS